MSYCEAVVASSSTRPIADVLYTGIGGLVSAHVLMWCPVSMTHGLRFTHVNPTNADSWPTTEYLSRTDVYILNLQVPEEKLLAYTRDIARVFVCPTTETLYEYVAHPTMRHIIPPIIKSVDRINLWLKMTKEDMWLREILHNLVLISQKEGIWPTLHSLSILMIVTPEAKRNQMGKELYDQKVIHVSRLMAGCKDDVVCLDAAMVKAWNVPESWEGRKGVLLDTTGIHNFDTTMAAEIAFEKYKGVDFFVNYHRVEWGAISKPGYARLAGRKMRYHARIHPESDMNLLECSRFQGHLHTAGAEGPVAENFFRVERSHRIVADAVAPIRPHPRHTEKKKG